MQVGKYSWVRDVIIRGCSFTVDSNCSLHTTLMHCWWPSDGISPLACLPRCTPCHLIKALRETLYCAIKIMFYLRNCTFQQSQQLCIVYYHAWEMYVVPNFNSVSVMKMSRLLFALSTNIVWSDCACAHSHLCMDWLLVCIVRWSVHVAEHMYSSSQKKLTFRFRCTQKETDTKR